MRILVLGGMHGNEMLGIKLVESLVYNPIEGIDAIIANPDAVKAQTRYIETDLNRSFGTSDPSSVEENRAQELSEIVATYDIVFDFHNTQTAADSCCFVGVNCSPMLYDQVRRLGFGNLIEATYDCINKYHDNTVSIEISVGDELDSVEYWRRQFENIGTDTSGSQPVQLYRFDSRVTWDQSKKNNFKDWQPFIELSDKDKRSVKRSGRLAPIFIGSRFTPYYATLVRYVKQV